jgi:outer membrane protein
MKHKLTSFLMAACAVSVAALAQTGTTTAAASPAPAAPSAAAAPVVTNPTGTKVGTLNVEQAIFASNEGQKEFEALSKKLEPKQTELKNLNDEIDGLKKQLNTQGDKLNEDTRSGLVKQIEQKQKTLDRAVQDARDDAQAQQNEIAQRILQKMAPVITKYATDNGFGVLIDTSNPWPNGPVLWAGPAVDITKPVVDAYNAQSGVPAPTPSAAKPGAGRGTIAPKPTLPTAPKPQGTQPPK